MNIRTGNTWGLGLLVLAGLVVGVNGAPTMGQSAKYFEAQGSDGKSYRLSDYAGKYVVLQWYNKDCPFVRKHYESGNMQSLQAKYTAKSVIWFEIISSAPGEQGYLTATQAEQNRASTGSKATATLLDPEGKIGRLYGAKTTPHMFIISPEGILIYQGAIDNRNSTDGEDIPGAKNYVAAALDEALTGKPITVSSTHPYGCSVKYK
jgi:peroxiredoxin